MERRYKAKARSVKKRYEQLQLYQYCYSSDNIKKRQKILCKTNLTLYFRSEVWGFLNFLLPTFIVLNFAWHIRLKSKFIFILNSLFCLF